MKKSDYIKYHLPTEFSIKKDNNHISRKTKIQNLIVYLSDSVEWSNFI